MATSFLSPKLALDFTTASLDSRITFTRLLDTATRVNSSGYIEGVVADTPRFNYDPITLACKGLLIEETRTNLVTYSQDFSQWNGVNNTTVNTDVATAPNNLTEADEIVGAVTSGGNQIVRTVTGLTTSTNYVLSVFFKPVVGGYACIRLGLTGFDGTTRQATINVDTGVLVSSSNATLLSVENFANGFKRFSIRATSGSGAGTTSFRIYGADATGVPFSSFPGQKVIVWGAQLEAGAFATSYIPTTTTALTRNADVATITGTNFSDFWQAAKGGASVLATPSTVSGTRPLVQFDDNTADNIIALRGNTTNPELYVRSGGVDQAQIDAGTIAANTAYSLTGWWQANFCAARKDSGARVEDLTAIIPTVTQARLGSDGTNYLNGHLATINYYDQFSGEIYTRRKNKAVFSVL